MSKHSKFISSGISGVLEKGLQAIQLCGDGMETYPLGEYIMQALFLQMTGFNEQKLKCILWELATDDYEFRYEFLKTPHGECSSYKDKNDVLKSLLSYIGKLDLTPCVASAVTDAESVCTNIFEHGVMREWFPREYRFFCDFLNNDFNQYVLDDTGKQKRLFKQDTCLSSAFEKLHRHRNRCAHNTLSYQENLPAFNALCADDYKYENWFVRFFILVLIDNLFSNLYQKYEIVRNNRV